MTDIEDYLSGHPEYFDMVVVKIKEVLNQYPDKEDEPDFALETIKAVISNLQEEVHIKDIKSVRQYINN